MFHYKKIHVFVIALLMSVITLVCTAAQTTTLNKQLSAGISGACLLGGFGLLMHSHKVKGPKSFRIFVIGAGSVLSFAGVCGMVCAARKAE